MSRLLSKKILAIVLGCVGLIGIGFLLTIPHLVTSDMVNMHVDFSEVYAANDYGLESDVLKLETFDGHNVVTYYVPAREPQGSIIFLSGIHNPSVTAFYGHAQWFRDLGYDSYLLEMRAHGESDGELISLGYKETLDVDAVVKHIMSNAEMAQKPIVVYGLSMGGSVAINAIGNNSEIDGLVSLSAYSSFEDNFADNMLLMGAPKAYVSIQKPFVKLYTNFKYGWQTAHLSPKEQIANLGSRPALLIHSTGDDQVPIDNMSRILKNAPAHVLSWEVDGNKHFILDDEAFFAPWTDEEYANKIQSFFKENF
ncbi:alpha/beta hydrolase [Bacillus sp. HMF5848]|uniref:alpha/beta hydrolase n=1 Tax=Bacillus sp. HMF5848 TaxID=2495421 RepID=UPI000F7982F1|nr:alpha/beta fold hydrolase [Bacillus sp. HMF5848]RSK28770.1 alpha/beta hydrolase [Bacillus sp. HMF5848]